MGLSVDMAGAILNGYGFVRRDRPPANQWELTIDASAGFGFKLLRRYDVLRRYRWGEGHCGVFATHIRFCLDGRKKNQYRGNFPDVARPEDPDLPAASSFSA